MHNNTLGLELPVKGFSVETIAPVLPGGRTQINPIELRHNALKLGLSILKERELVELKVEALGGVPMARVTESVVVLKNGAMANIEKAIADAFRAGVESCLNDLEAFAKRFSDRGEVDQAKAYMDLADMLRGRPTSDRLDISTEVREE